MRLSNPFDDELLILFAQRTRTGQANPPPVQIRRHFSPDTFVPPIQRLGVHRFPDRTRLDVRRIEKTDQVRRRHPELRLVDEETTQPAGVQAACGRLMVDG